MKLRQKTKNEFLKKVRIDSVRFGWDIKQVEYEWCLSKRFSLQFRLKKIITNNFSTQCFMLYGRSLFVSGDHVRCKVAGKPWNSSSVNLQEPFRFVNPLLFESIKCLKQYLKLHKHSIHWSLTVIFFCSSPFENLFFSRYAHTIVVKPRPLNCLQSTPFQKEICHHCPLFSSTDSKIMIIAYFVSKTLLDETEWYSEKEVSNLSKNLSNVNEK